LFSDEHKGVAPVKITVLYVTNPSTFKILKKGQFIFQIAPSHKAKRHETHVPTIHNQFWCGNLRERDNLEDLGVDWRKMYIYEWIFKTRNSTAWTGLNWLTKWTRGGIL